MKKLFSTLILSIFFVATFAATNFLDLAKTTVRQSQWVQQFDNNTKKGGGYFKYYNLSNVGIPNIAGWQIKVANSTTGYYRRVDEVSNFHADWCGAINLALAGTLSSYGWTQSQADSMWSVGLVTVATDGYDDASLNYLLYITDAYDFWNINTSPLYYFTRKRVQIPDYPKKIYWQGNGAIIQTLNATTYDVIGRDTPTNLGDAEVQLNSWFKIVDLEIEAQGNQTCFQPGASQSSIYENIQTYSGRYGMVFRFSLNTNVTSCSNFFSTYGFLFTNGIFPGASVSNSCSNQSSAEHCRAYSSPGAGDSIAFQFIALSGGCFNGNTVEGTHYEWGCVADGLSSTTALGFDAYNNHWEPKTASTDTVNEGFFKIRLAGGVVTINGSNGIHPKVMVNAGSTVGTVTLIVERTKAWNPAIGGTKWFYNAGTCSWKINYNYQFDFPLSQHTTFIPPTFCGIVPTFQDFGNNTYQYIPR